MEFTKEFTEESLKRYMLDKPKRLIEYVNEDPLYVLKEVFKPQQWSFIGNELSDWLIIGLSSDYNAYDDWPNRLTLVFFYDQLNLLIEALFILHLQNIENSDKNEKIATYKVHLLTKEQMENPKQVIVAFFERYRADYVIRELDDWLASALSYPGSWRDNIVSAYHVFNTYRNVLCLVKSAERILLANNLPVIRPILEKRQLNR
jgi:hypothetical protein